MSRTAICCCANRNELLEKTLPTWLRQREPFNHIILVDWGGSERVEDVIPKDNRIILVKVIGETRWILTHAYNLALRFTPKQCCIYKLDTDYLLGSNFTATYYLPTDYTKVFWAGNWRNYKINSNPCNISGCLVVRKSSLGRVNGYNERIIEYGYDDDDLYERLEHSGCKRIDLKYGLVRHIPHDHELRSCGSNEIQRSRLIQANKLQAHNQPWTIMDTMSAWEITEVNSNYYKCTRALSSGV